MTLLSFIEDHEVPSPEAKEKDKVPPNIFLAPTGALGMSLSVCLSVCPCDQSLSRAQFLHLSGSSLSHSVSLCLSLFLSKHTHKVIFVGASQYFVLFSRILGQK